MFFSSNVLKAEKGEAAGEENASPSKTNKKKRGHIKDDPDEEEPPAKKTKARAKKEKKIKNEDTDGGPEDEGPAIKTEHEIKKEPKIKNEDSHGDGGSENEGPAIKTELSVKKESKIKNEDADEGSGNEGPTTKKAKPRVKREPKVKNEDADGNSENGGPSTRKNISRVGNEPKTNEDASTRSDIQEPVKKATRASTKKGKKVVADEADGDLDHVAQPVQKGRKRVKKAAAEDEAVLDVKDENSDHQILQPRRLRAPRKAAMASKIKDESTETDASDSASEFDREPSEDALESQMTRKKATKKAVNGKAKVKKGSKPKVRMPELSSIGQAADSDYRERRLPLEPSEIEPISRVNFVSMLSWTSSEGLML